MTRFLASRALRSLLTLVGVLAITFALGRLSGDPVALLLPQSATVEDYLAMRARLGLDAPLPLQFVDYVRGVLQGDFGRSLAFNRPLSTSSSSACRLRSGSAAPRSWPPCCSVCRSAWWPRCGAAAASIGSCAT